MRRAILLTGLIRDPGNFMRFIGAVEQHRHDTELTVVFSTWINEVSRYPEIARALQRIEAILVEQNQPNLLLRGHVLHQLVALEGGLSILSDDTFVLKSRPDFCHADDIKRFLAMAPSGCAPNRALPSQSDYRIGIISAFGANPCYINDITFVAMASDLRHLPLLPMSYPIRYSRLAPEQLYWGGGLRVDRIPVFDTYFRVNVGLLFNNQRQSHQLRDMLVRSPLFAKVMAASALFMTDNFDYLAPDADRVRIGQAAGNYTLEDLLWGSNAHDDGLVDQHPATYTNSFKTAGLWDALRSGGFAGSDFGDRMLAALGDYDHPGGMAVMRGQLPLLHEEADSFAREIANQLEIHELKHFQDAGMTRTIDAPPPAWTLGQTGEDLTTRLERENNELRRLVDQHNRQTMRET